MRSSERPRHFQYARRMIFLGIVFVPLAPYLLAILVSYGFFLNVLLDKSNSAGLRVAQDHALGIDRYLSERKQDLRFVEQVFDANYLYESNHLETIFAAVQEINPAFVDIGIIDENGTQVAYAGPHDLQDALYGDSSWFQEAMQQGSYVSDVFLGHRGQPHFVVAIKSHGPSPYVIRATIDSASFGRLVDSIRLGMTGAAYIVNKNGVLQTSLADEAPLLAQDPDFSAYSATDDESTEQGWHAFDFIGGSSYVYSTAPLNDGRWNLVARIESGEAHGAILEAALYVVAISLFGGLVTIPLAFWVANKIGDALIEADSVKEHLRTRLSRSVRLATLGEMTANFAHEINNPLQVMRTELTLMSMLIKDTPLNASAATMKELKLSLMDAIDQLELQIERCATVTHSILSFGRQEQPRVTTLEVGKLMDDMVSMVSKKAEVQSIKLNVQVHPDTPMVQADAAKLQQIFLNLLNNAIYAIVERHGHAGGKIDFFAEPYSTGWVKIQVKDNGTGIPKGILANIYTPFFTTKPPKKGTGLGLAVCYGLIESMGGSIEVSTAENEGTAFTILLPSV